ncbi:hypothetical protein CIB95_04725 [Lottiidibacillus patelloidae]|uniref:Cytosolic protein n=1 Tax=Lottiidibacillus patelloidae TaxID=2670334 RepID=A0A263BVT9_9BACI|nr:YqgQ family protein [Lottiidibacillus patelloidae]OZM57678.1 hypothetical protein CIB95_04725 [Lottiidibacillus patelloidae]
MKTFFEVQQLLKNYGTIIYTGDKELDYQLMEDEIRELYNSKLITIEQFKQSLLIIKSRKNKGE